MDIVMAMLILGHGDLNTRLSVRREAEIILNVAQVYNLDDAETRRLVAIRRVENGGPGIEFGVGSDDEKHEARRFAQYPGPSLRVQARWCAGTIAKHHEDLHSFAHRWYPKNAHAWERMVLFYMTATEGQLNGVN